MDGNHKKKASWNARFINFLTDSKKPLNYWWYSFHLIFLFFHQLAI